MDFKKFAQSVRNLLYSEETILIEGCFKDAGKDKVFSGDNFEAHIVKESGKKMDIELIYKTYIDWYNYTRNEQDNERVFVSVKQDAKGDGDEK